MNVSKTLSSAVAAVTIVGAVGLAYAQSTSDPATRPADTAAPMVAAPATDNSNASSSLPSSTPSTTSTTTSSDTSVAPAAELQPKADRN